jgi:uncharacterized membrane protein
MSNGSTISLVYLIGSVVLLALAIPLTLEKVPPNGLYGFRTAKTRSDPKIWYAANKALGKALLVAGAVLLAVSAFFLVSGDHYSLGVASTVQLGTTVVTLLVAIIYARSALSRM